MSRAAGKAGSGYGRGDLMDWLNGFLGTHYTKVEQLGNGAAFCQILDALYPGSVRLQKVNFNAVTEPEMVANYKVLQDCFNRQKIQRNVPVETLVKCHYMASLEMLQWMKKFFDENYSGGEYNGPERRAECGVREPGDTSRGKPTTAKRSARVKVTAPPPTTVKKAPIQGRAAPPQSTIKARGQRPMGETPGPGSRAQLLEIRKLKEEVEALKKDNQTLLEERNFYFNKLQRVETLCQAKEGDAFAESILEVLYETDEENGFVSPDELDI